MLAPLDNETIFKRAFTDKIVFEYFIKDIFGIDIQVGKIETEKRFAPVIGHIDFKLDIYAETTDNRFVIEIQKIDYDYNFDRFLHYFLMVLADQQKTSSMYTPSQEVLGVVVLTRPYKIEQKTGEPIKESVMTIDFNPRTLKDEKILLWDHNLVFLNPNPKYNRNGVPAKYEDWLNLIYSSFQKSEADYKINFQNPGVARVANLIDYEKLDPVLLAQMKQAESTKVTEQLLKDKSRAEGIDIGIEKGIDIGIEKGIDIGIEKKEDIAIKNALKKGKLSPEEIADMLEVPVERVLKIKKEIDTY
jgi:hypothetical protein